MLIFFSSLFFRYKFENYSGSNFVLMKMTINNVQSTDFGRYGCYAENSEGSGENFIKLGRKLIFIHVYSK